MLPAMRYLAHRRFALMAVAAGMVLALSTFAVGFFADDFAFLQALTGPNTTGRSRIFSLYEFARGVPAETQALVQRGLLPWWTTPGVKLRFMRPLSSALFALDHAIFGLHAAAYHVHALLWYLALLIVVARVLRSALSLPTANLALLMFALSGSHGEPVGWLASRHVLIAATPSMLGVLAQVAYRERGYRPGRWLAILGVSVGLLGSEAALGAIVYWIAYEAVGGPQPRPWRARVRGLVTPFAIILGYLIAYRSLGYGAAHNSAYLDPLANPARFGAAIAVRVPVLLAEQFAAIPAGMAWTVGDRALALAGSTVTCLVGVVGWRVRSTIPVADRRALRWLGLGAVGSLLLAVGATPGSRLLLVPGIGAYAVLAATMRAAGERVTASALSRSGTSIYAVVMLIVHLALAPVMFLGSISFFAGVGAKSAAIDRSLDGVLGVQDPVGSAARHVYVLCASDPWAAFYVAPARAVRAPRTLATWSELSLARGTHRVTRRDERTLFVSVDPPMLSAFFETLFRSRDDAIAVGHGVELNDARVTVLATRAGGPTELEDQIHDSIDDPKLLLLAWREGQLVEVTPLAIGIATVIPWSAGPTGFF